MNNVDELFLRLLNQTHDKIDILLETKDWDSSTTYERDLFKVTTITSDPTIGLVWDLCRSSNIKGDAEEIWVHVRNLNDNKAITGTSLIQNITIIDRFKQLESKINNYENARSLHQIEQVLSKVL